ncbi:MAG: S1 RNA-binding domain-containing protein, partial [Acutalibacteraceae bacterium]|nr:S1 RNA-binding domain-containing protein [Acutalibacteraceae bacterium]
EATEVVETPAEETKAPAKKKATTKKAPAKKATTKKETSKKKTTKKEVVDNGDGTTTWIVKPADEGESEATETPKADTPATETPAEEKVDKPTTPAEKPKATRKRKAKPAEPKTEVVSFSGEKTVLTEEDKLRENILDLVASQKTGKILTGKIVGIEQHGTVKVAVLYHGEFKVIIPAEYLIPASSVPKSSKNYTAAISHSTIKRLGAEVDYIVEGFDHENNVAIGNRLKAMEARRKHFYFGFDRQGNKLVYPDAYCEARVVSVVRSGVFVEVLGVETFVRLNELSYQRINNTEDEFRTGMTVLVKVLALDTSDKDNIRISVSIKQAKENPATKALAKISEGGYYMGKVTMVDVYGVFVSLDCGIDCLCKLPFYERPIRGAKASVKVMGVDRENGKVWGVISDVSSVV